MEIKYFASQQATIASCTFRRLATSAARNLAWPDGELDQVREGEQPVNRGVLQLLDESVDIGERGIRQEASS